MAAAIPTEVPTQLVAGDTFKFKLTFGDYLAGDGWAFSITFVRRGSAAVFTVNATADGNDHLVNVAAATTTDYLAGEYDGQGYVTYSGERFLVWTGKLTVLSNFALSQGEDTRTTSRKILDSLDAAILKVSQAQASGGSGGIVEWQAEGLRIRRDSPAELLAALTSQRDRFASICANEDARAALSAGRGTGRRILVEFSNA